MENSNHIHGEWKISRNQRTLIIEVVDAWNIEGVQSFIEEFKNSAEPIIGGSWSVITIMDNWNLATPDCVPLVHELAKWMVLCGCDSECHIFPKNGLKKSVIAKYDADKDSISGFERRAFDNLQSGISWLELRGYSFDPN